MTSKSALPLRLWLAAGLVFIMAACSPNPQPSVTPLVDATPSIAPTDIATFTPTPEPPTVWLIAGADVQAALKEQLSSWLTQRSAVDGFTLSVLESFQQSSMPADLQAAIFLFPTEDIGNLAANLPQTQFVAITGSDLAAAANLSVVHTAENQAAFLAGYLATLNAPDFRSGALLVDGAANTAQLQDSFLNGGRFFCGRCAPVYGPIVIFPQVGLVPANADAARWQAAFDTLNQSVIEMVYIPTEGLSQEFVAYLAGKNVGIISNAPPPAGSEGHWVATVQADVLSAVEGIWPALMAGEGGKAVQAGLLLSNVNSANLSVGRQTLAEKIIPDLISGAISPLSVP